MIRFFIRRWPLTLVLLLAVVLLGFAGMHLQSWRAQQEFEATLAMIKRKGGNLHAQYRRTLWVDRLCNTIGMQFTDNLGKQHIVELDGCQLTDAELKGIARIPYLSGVYLLNCDLDEQGLRWFTRASALEMVILDGSKVTDRCLSHLQGCRSLSSVSLQNTAVTDEGIEKFCQATGIRYLNVSGPNIKGVELLDLQITTVEAGKPISLTSELIIRGRFRVHGNHSGNVTCDLRLDRTGPWDPNSGIQALSIDPGRIPFKQEEDAYSFEVRVPGEGAAVPRERGTWRPDRYYLMLAVSCHRGKTRIRYPAGKVEFELVAPEHRAAEGEAP